MFIATDFLIINYGVDEKIARFFVDREPPVNNLYWHEKLLYLRPGAGYIFIPLIVDLLFKSGISKDELLGNTFVTTMEQIGHISALEETNQINAATAIQQCADLVKPNCHSETWYNDVLAYLQGNNNFITQLASPFKALHRGDVFLFALCAVHFPKEKETQLVQQWFALITTLLLQDDAEDVQSDQKTGDENAFLEHGLSTESIAMAEDLLKKNTAVIASLNGTMAKALEQSFYKLLAKPITFLTQNNYDGLR